LKIPRQIANGVVVFRVANRQASLPGRRSPRNNAGLNSGEVLNPFNLFADTRQQLGDHPSGIWPVVSFMYHRKRPRSAVTASKVE
jgi:hypothetical protein